MATVFNEKCGNCGTVTKWKGGGTPPVCTKCGGPLTQEVEDKQP